LNWRLEGHSLCHLPDTPSSAWMASVCQSFPQFATRGDRSPKSPKFQKSSKISRISRDRNSGFPPLPVCYLQFACDPGHPHQPMPGHTVQYRYGCLTADLIEQSRWPPARLRQRVPLRRQSVTWPRTQLNPGSHMLPSQPNRHSLQWMQKDMGARPKRIEGTGRRGRRLVAKSHRNSLEGCNWPI
jgi:hypothetical protein